MKTTGLKIWLFSKLGGEATARVVFVLALVLALDTADIGAVGAMANQIQSAFNITKAQLGLLATVSAGVSALPTILFGWLVDRSRRTTVLAIAIGLWALAMVASAAASSYGFLLFARGALGALTAAAMPAVASLVGDYFTPGRRGRIYGFILAGEVVGAAFGLLVAGELTLLSWRLGFLALALPALWIAWLVRKLPEPPRDGSGRIAEDRTYGQDLAQNPSHQQKPAEESPQTDRSQLVREKTRERHIEPREQLVFSQDPNDRSLWWAIGYILRIPTNLVLIIASALGYYFFAGLRVFGLEYVKGHFGITHSQAIGWLALVGVASLFGVMVGGRLGDRLLARGILRGRVIVVVCGYFAAAGLFLPALLFARLSIVIPLLMLAGFAFLGIFPPLDAARLDIMHGHLWGRAEAIRMAFRKAAEALAPVLFGYIAGLFGGGTIALQNTFLVMLVPLFAGGLIGLIALRTYPRDTATADAFVRRTEHRQP